MKPIPRILLTGGSGSFGRALARFLLSHDMVERLCIFSRGEHAQADMRAQLADDPRLRFFIGDVRDEDRLLRAMQGVELVIHAAALKRIEVGHYNPEEMVKTNVFGAMNVIAAARRSPSVERVVALSTDKAFSPRSAYGYSKAMMESLMIAANDTSGFNGPRFVVTRYGNVLGSAGSVLPRWMEMIAAGATEVPTTSPECTRFMMLMEEAIELVIGAAADPNPGAIAVPDLPAYRLSDLATALGVKMRIIGLPPHEKLHESMKDGASSETVRRLTVEEIQQYIRIGYSAG